MSRLSRSTSLAVPPSPSASSSSSSSVRCLPFFTRSQTPLGRLFGICLASGCVSLKCSTCHLVLHKRQTEGGQVGFSVFVAFSISVWLSLSLCFFASLSLSLSALCQAGHDCRCLWFGVEFVAATATETVFRTLPLHSLPLSLSALTCLACRVRHMNINFEGNYSSRWPNSELRLNQSHLTAFAPRLTRFSLISLSLDFCWCQSNIAYG